jgi:tetratricopeptide (TPR) repeat protein
VPVHPQPSILRVLVLSTAVFSLAADDPIGRAGARQVSGSGSQPTAQAKLPDPGPLILEDAPERFIPPKPLTEAEKNREEALSLFATGRTLERQQRFAEALQYYQRALRCDPRSLTILRSILPLAKRLKRHAEAIRYALKEVEMGEPDPKLLRQLGGYLTIEHDWEGALRLYEKALEAKAGQKEDEEDILNRMEMGRLYYLIDKHDKAADCFACVIHALAHPEQFGLAKDFSKKVLTEPGAAYALFGECFLLSGRFDEAVAAFQKSHEVEPAEGLLHFHLAQVYQRQGKPTEALRSLETSFGKGLADAGTAPYQLLAELIEKLGRSDELIERLEKLRGAEPDNVPLAYYLAGKYLEADEYAKAEPVFLAVLKKNPTLTGYRGLLQIYRKTGRVEPLLDALGDAVKATGTLDGLDAEAEAIAADPRLLRDLVELARKRLKDDPKKAGYGLRLAVALLTIEAKQFETAAEFFDLAIAADATRASDLRLAWGIRLLLEERAADAAKVFQKALQEDDDPIFYFYLAGAMALDNQTDKALDAAKKATELAEAAASEAADEAMIAREAAQQAPDDDEAAEKAQLASQSADRKKADAVRFRSRIAWVLFHAKRYPEADKAYRDVLERYDGDYSSPETRQLLRDARLALSNLRVLQEDLPKAEEWLEEVLDEFPDDVGASNDLGYLWADQGKNLAQALKMIQKAVDAEPDNIAYRDSLGWVYYRLGRYGDAVAELEKAVAFTKKGEEPDAVILDHLGDAYLKANRVEKAKEAWRRAVEAYKKQQESAKAQAVEKKIQEHAGTSGD